MMIYAVIDKNNIVVNIVVWDGDDKWSPGDDFSAVEADESSRIGSTYKDGKFLPPKEEPVSGS